MATDRRAPPRRAAGFSLLELSIIVVIGGILATFAVPNYSVSSETVRVDRAAADLRSIWRAQRRHRLETGEFASSLADLVRLGHLAASFDEQRAPFLYDLRLRSRSRFLIEARRAGPGDWSGTITLDETGVFDGAVRNSDGRTVQP